MSTPRDPYRLNTSLVSALSLTYLWPTHQVLDGELVDVLAGKDMELEAAVLQEDDADLGRALAFDGSLDSYCRNPNLNLASTPWGFACWFRTSTRLPAGTSKSILSFSSNNGGNFSLAEVDLVTDVDDSTSVDVFYSNGSVASTLSQPCNYADDTPHMLWFEARQAADRRFSLDAGTPAYSTETISDPDFKVLALGRYERRNGLEGDTGFTGRLGPVMAWSGATPANDLRLSMYAEATRWRLFLPLFSPSLTAPKVIGGAFV